MFKVIAIIGFLFFSGLAQASDNKDISRFRAGQIVKVKEGFYSACKGTVSDITGDRKEVYVTFLECRGTSFSSRHFLPENLEVIRD